MPMTDPEFATVSELSAAFGSRALSPVDVTDALVARFNPTEKVQKWIESGKTQQPMPLIEAVMTLRPER